MSGYGAQIFHNGNMTDIVDSLNPAYVVDIISGDFFSGTRTYSPPPGKMLKYSIASLGFSSTDVPYVEISGNTATYSGGGDNIIVIYFE